MPTTFKPPNLSRRAVLTYLVEITLLAVSLYGFWKWTHYSSAGDDLVEGEALFYLILFGVLPLVLFNLIAVREAVAVGYSASLSGFQFRIDHLQKRLNTQDDFFQSITNDMPSTLTIYNNENEYWFLNASAARELGSTENDVLGRKPVEVLGAERGRAVERHLAYVRQTGKGFETLSEELNGAGRVHYVKTSYQPFSSFGDFSGGIIARGEDVTTIVVERERRENLLRQVLSTLVAVVDRRDPYASGHSARVGQLSRALAVEMQLSDREIDAAEIAGSLMNFGKVLVSRSILTKTEPLSPEELQRIRDGILTSADILSRIEFSTPVVPTLRQVLERFDGTGAPDGLSGEAILMTARVVSVANAFVAAVSPRAYRPGVELAVAAERLAQDKGRAFDPRVIAALEIYIGKNAAKLDWLAVSKGISSGA